MTDKNSCSSLCMYARKHYLAVIVNILVFVAMSGLVAMSQMEVFPVYRRGFYCNDDTIGLPFQKDTVSTVMLIVITLGSALLTVALTETIQWHSECHTVLYSDAHQKEDHPVTGMSWPRLGLQIVVVIFGFLAVVVVTELTKLSTGRLRPYFMDVCELQPGSYNCSHGYVTEYTCTQTDKIILNDARKSFISGHASISFYHVMFIMTYLWYHVPVKYFLGCVFLQSVAFCLACYISITRVTDHAHHPSDVIIGALLGALAGIMIARFLTGVFKSFHSDDTVRMSEVKVA